MWQVEKVEISKVIFGSAYCTLCQDIWNGGFEGGAY
jgi:hypothetical protein